LRAPRAPTLSPCSSSSEPPPICPPRRGGGPMSTRREFLTTALAGGAAAALAPRRASAAVKSMTVVHESSFIKAFDDFFVKTLSPEYEKLTGIKVGYEAVSVGSMLTRLTTIVETKAGP